MTAGSASVAPSRGAWRPPHVDMVQYRPSTACVLCQSWALSDFANLRPWSTSPVHGHSPCHALASSAALQLTPRESEKLLVYVAADLARRRRGRGLKLNLPEAVALITGGEWGSVEGEMALDQLDQLGAIVM